MQAFPDAAIHDKETQGTVLCLLIVPTKNLPPMA